MKKRLYLIAAAALALVACAKEEAYQPTESTIPGAKRIVLGASFELPGDPTKSDYDAAGNFTWSDDDAIWIGCDVTSGDKNWGGGSIIAGQSEIGPGYATAQFDCTIMGEGTAIAAVFPKTVQPSYSAGALSLTLPATIAWTDTQLANPANATMQVDNVMVARYVDIYSEGYAHGITEGIQFHNVGGLFCLTLKNVPAGADKLIFTADKKINGTFAVSNVVNSTDGHNYPEIATAETETKSEKSVTITFPTISNGENKMTFFIPVPVGSYVIGFDVQNAEATSLWAFSASKPNAVERGHIVKMPTLSHVIVGGSGDGATNIITTPSGFSGTVNLPSTNNSIYVRMNQTGGAITLAYSDDPALHPANVYLQALGNVETLDINLPDSHVELTGEDDVQHVITNVSSYTSYSTLKVDDKVKIGKDGDEDSGITITGGSLDLAAAVEGKVIVNIPAENNNETEEKVAINITSAIKDLVVTNASTQTAPDKIYVSLGNGASVEKTISVPEVNCNLYVAPGVAVSVIDTKAAENTVEGNVETLSATGASTIVTVTKAGSVTESITSADEATVVIENRTQEEVAAGTAGVVVDVVAGTTEDGGTITKIDGTVVAYIGSTPYTTLDAAFEAVKTGETIVLQKDITQDAGFKYDKTGVSAELNLNGYTVTVNTGANVNNRAFKINNGTLEVYGGSIVAVGSGTTSSNGAGCYGAFRVEAGGVLNAHDLELTNSRPWGLNVKVLGGTAELTNVKITSSYGGGIEVTEADLGTHSQGGTATLTNCTFTQTGYFDHCSTALSVSGGSSLTINSGSYTSENYALYVFSSGGYITVKDGTFSGNKNGVAIIAAIDTNTYPQYTGGLVLEGGDYTGGFNITSPASLSITGGTYSVDPTAYLASGYTTSGSNPWTVVKLEGAVTNLAELQDAITNNVTPIYYVGDAITEAFTLAPSAATTINGLKVNYKPANVTSSTVGLTINGDVTLNDANIVTNAYCGVSISEGKTVTFKNSTVDGSSAALDNSRAMNISANTTVTIDGTTVKGSATAGYSRCLNILDEGAHVDIVNGSVLSVSHYAINLPSTTVNAVINVEDSSVNTGWAITNIWKTGNTINLTNCTLNSVNDKNYDKDGWNDFSAFVFNNDGTNISSGNVLTVNNCTVNVSSTKGNRQSLISMRGNNDTIKFIGSDGTIALAENGGITYQWGQLHSTLNNTLSFDKANYDQISESIDAACVVTNANNLYTISYVTEVYYYWNTNDGQKGTYCSLADPFVQGWISDNEYIRLEKNVTLTANLTVALSSALHADNYFTLTLGDYSITKGSYSIILPAGLSVKTDKQTNVFTGADGAMIVETVSNNEYTYTAVQSVAQIGESYYATLEAAVAAVPDNKETTITMIGDVAYSVNKPLTVQANKNIVLDLNGHTISHNAPEAKEAATINNLGTLTINDSSAGGTGKISMTGIPDSNWLYGIWTINNWNTLTINGGTIENLSDRGLGFAVHSGAYGRGTTTNINGGIISHPKYCALCLYYQSSGTQTATISGGEIIGDASPIWFQICTDNPSYNVTINGGRIVSTSDKYLPIYIWAYSSGFNASNVNLSISGGTVQSNTPESPVVDWDDVESAFVNANKNVITGGTFNVDPSSQVADGYEAVKSESGNNWNVQEANGVAQIGNTIYATLANAVSSASENDNVKIIKAGNYSIPAITKNLTIEAAVSGVVVEHTTNTTIANIESGKTATFKNITFNLGDITTATAHGFGTLNGTNGSLVMNGCTINGALNLFGESSFTNCAFSASGIYNIWAVNDNATFTGCSFTNTNRAVNVYDQKHGSAEKNVSFSSCTFVSTGTTPKKAAINIHDNPDNQAEGAKYNVTINTCTTTGTWASSTEDTGEETTTDCTSSLWMVSDITHWPSQGITVTVNGEEVFSKSITVGGDDIVDNGEEN